MQEATESIVDQFNDLPTEEKPAAAEAIAEANPKLFPHSDRAKVALWRYLLVGIFLIAIACVIGAIIFVLNEADASPFFVIIAAAVTGSIGLFSKGPLT